MPVKAMGRLSIILEKIFGFFGIKTRAENWLLFLKYCLVGAAATVVDYSLLYSLTEFVGVWYLWSATVAFIGGATTNYLLNRLWTFENTDQRIARQVATFLIIAGVGILLNNAILALGVEVFGWWYMLAKVISTAITLIWNFFGHRYITFKQS